MAANSFIKVAKKSILVSKRRDRDIAMVDEYGELHRPQFHFTARKNWINDPNGLVFHDGLWHLFFQHNQDAPTWGKMWWGHAVSRDLFHWQQCENVLHPDDMGSMFSGSAVVDRENTAGFGADALLLFYTAYGKHAKPTRPTSQCLAYSTDNGKTWTKYVANPIVGWMEADNRDPKVVWHKSARRWIMALYLEDDRYCLLSSSDAKTWTRFQEIRLNGDSECPDFFPIADDTGAEKWVFSGAGGSYSVGDFDGKLFVPETPVLQYELGRNGYAAQTWSNAPNNRRIQVSWMAGGRYPEMPFNQQLSVPVELSLAGSGGSVTLNRWPVHELDLLRVRTVSVGRKTISKDKPMVAQTDAKLLDVSFKVFRQSAKGFYVVARGHPIVFDWDAMTLSVETSGKSKMTEDRPFVKLSETVMLDVRLIIDRTSIEVFLDGGSISASYCFLPDGYVNPLVLHSYSGEQIIEDFELHELVSTWKA